MLNETERLASIIESLLFVSDRPLTVGRLKEICEVQDLQLIHDAVELLRQSYQDPRRGITLQEVANGLQLRTVEANANWILEMTQGRPQRLSRAALETLAIVAYRQPLTRPEAEQIRGVDCGGVFRTLLEKDLVKILGKKEEPGNPLVYGTTETFLSFFGIKNLRDLPSLKEYADLRESNETIPLEAFVQAAELRAATLPTPAPQVSTSPQEAIEVDETIPYEPPAAV